MPVQFHLRWVAAYAHVHLCNVDLETKAGKTPHIVGQAVGIGRGLYAGVRLQPHAVIAASGSGFVKQMNAKIDGGVEFLSFPNTQAALDRVHKVFPKTYWSVVKPGKGLTAVRKPTTLITYDYLLWTHKSEPDEVVYKIAKIMYTKAKELKGGGPLWKSYDPKDVAKNEGADLPYHPAAIKFYKEAGVWPGKM